jgi:hypothetical protein
MLYNIDIWLEIVGTIWNSAESSNFSCAQVKIFMRSVYTNPRVCTFGSVVSRGLWSQRNEHLGTKLASAMRFLSCVGTGGGRWGAGANNTGKLHRRKASPVGLHHISLTCLLFLVLPKLSLSFGSLWNMCILNHTRFINSWCLYG